jgi:glutaredoxin
LFGKLLTHKTVIIFSKSYCPYSTKAKRILLEEYTIVPSPFVVELDLHPLGPKLQDCLAKNTGRRTVPNVLVNGRSIGGGDDMEALDSAGELSSKIKDYAGKRVMEITRKEREKDEEKAL